MAAFSLRDLLTGLSNEVQRVDSVRARREEDRPKRAGCVPHADFSDPGPNRWHYHRGTNQHNVLSSPRTFLGPGHRQTSGRRRRQNRLPFSRTNAWMFDVAIC